MVKDKGTIILKKLSDKKLIELVQSAHDSLFVTECFGKRDCMIYYFGLNELEKRGYEVKEERQLIIKFFK